MSSVCRVRIFLNTHCRCRINVDKTTSHYSFIQNLLRLINILHPVSESAYQYVCRKLLFLSPQLCRNVVFSTVQQTEKKRNSQISVKITKERSVGRHNGLHTFQKMWPYWICSSLFPCFYCRSLMAKIVDNKSLKSAVCVCTTNYRQY